MRIVVDTNVVVSSYMFPGSTPGAVIEYWYAGTVELVVSMPLIAEYERVLRYPHISVRLRLTDDGLRKSIQKFRDRGTLVEPDAETRVVTADPDDDVVVATAVAGNADYIVSGDKHLLELSEHNGIRIVTPAVFLAILEHDL